MSSTTRRTISPAPVRKSVTVKADIARAFEVFTAGMTRWWNPSNKIGPADFREAVIEPRVGGRWYEIDTDGSECDWGRVLAWDPPHRILIDWQISGEWAFDPSLHTEFEVRFSAVEGGGTLVEVEHRNLERFGEAAGEISSTFKSEGGFAGMLKTYKKVVEG